MLALSRRRGEAITIDTTSGPIEIQAVETHTGRAVLGITAPPGCRIWRNEIIQGGNRGAQSGRGTQAGNREDGTESRSQEGAGREDLGTAP